jgi:hypothetical protein
VRCGAIEESTKMNPGIEPIDSDDLRPLLDFARQETEPVPRLAALRAATQFALDEDAWQDLAALVASQVSALPPGSPARREAISVAAAIPLLSLRRWLRERAGDVAEPDTEWFAGALAAAGDASQAAALAERIAAGDIDRLPELAAMPLEHTALDPARIPTVPEYADPNLMLWRALALARIGDVAPLDEFLKGLIEPPPLFWADPWTIHDTLAAVRPIPAPMRAHLLDALALAGQLGDPARAAMAQQIIWACTGVADAEGTPLGAAVADELPDSVTPGSTVPGPVGPGRPAVSDESGPAGMTAADAAGPATPAGDDSGAARDRLLRLVSDPSALSTGPAPEDLDRIALLAPAAVDAFLLELLDAACRCLRTHTPCEPYLVPLGNAIVAVAERLPTTPNWPVEPLAEFYLRADPAALDRDQYAWLIARAPFRTVISALTNWAAGLSAPSDRRRVLELLGAAGASAAGQGASPWRGAGGSAPTAPERPPLIDDRAIPAMRGDPEDEPTGGDTDLWEEELVAGAGAPMEEAAPTEEAAPAEAPRSGPPTGPPVTIAPDDLEAGAGEPETLVDRRRVHAQVWCGDERRRSFVAGADHIVRCWIGLPEPERAAVSDHAIPAAHIPDEGLELVVQLEWKGQQAAGRVVLPASRSARTGDCDLALRVPEGERYVSATVAFLYRSRVFELVQLEGFVLKPGEPELPHHELLLRTQIDERQIIQLEDRTECDTAFVYGEEPAEDGGAAEPARTLLEFGAQGAARYSLAKTGTAVAWLNKELFVADKNLVRARARGGATEGEARLDDRDETVLGILRQLAQHGAAFYNQLTGQHFRDPGRRIQLLNRTPDEYMPLEFVYDRGFPADDAKLCDGWAEALAGDDDECPCCGPVAGLDEEALDNTPTLCPLGFWSLRKIIERLDPFAAGPLGEDRSVPRDGRRSLAPIDRALFGASHNVMEQDRAETLEALRRIVGEVRLADSWDAWRQAVRSGPLPLLVALPHHGIKDAQDYLELGGEETPEPARILKRGRLRHLYVNPNKRDPGPIVLLIGCETVAESATGYPAMARRFQQLHSSIVVGTLAKVLGRHAAPVARELVSQLAAVDDPEADFGTIMRRVRRRMLLKGYLMSMCLVALGDGDWHLGVAPPTPDATRDEA